MYVFGYDYFVDVLIGWFGLLWVVVLIDKVWCEMCNCLLFDNGDLLQGNLMGDYLVEQDRSGQWIRYLVIVVMNVFGYDVGMIGNYDFSYGLLFLCWVLEGVGFLLVVLNLKLCCFVMLVVLYLLLWCWMLDCVGCVYDLVIGVLGFLLSQIIDWEFVLCGEVQIIDIIMVVQDGIVWFQDLGVDLIVVLFYSGIGDLDVCLMMENVVIVLVVLFGIDVVIVGYMYCLFFLLIYFVGLGVDFVVGMLVGKFVVMVGFWGLYLGLIDFVLEFVVDVDVQ